MSTLTWLHQHATPLLYFVLYARQPAIQCCVWWLLAWMVRSFATSGRCGDPIVTSRLGRALAKTSTIGFFTLLVSYGLMFGVAFEWQWSPPIELELRFLASQEAQNMLVLLDELILIPILFVLVRVGRPSYGIPPLLPSMPRWPATLAIVGLLSAVAYFFPGTRIIETLPSRSLVSVLEEPIGQAWVTQLRTVLAITVVPIVEEFLFRGVLYDVFRRCIGIVGAVLITTFAFAAMHGSLERLPVLLMLGLALALLRVVSGSVGVPIAAHAALNWFAYF